MWSPQKIVRQEQGGGKGGELGVNSPGHRTSCTLLLLRLWFTDIALRTLSTDFKIESQPCSLVSGHSIWYNIFSRNKIYVDLRVQIITRIIQYSPKKPKKLNWCFPVLLCYQVKYFLEPWLGFNEGEGGVALR